MSSVVGVAFSSPDSVDKMSEILLEGDCDQLTRCRNRRKRSILGGFGGIYRFSNVIDDRRSLRHDSGEEFEHRHRSLCIHVGFLGALRYKVEVVRCAPVQRTSIYMLTFVSCGSTAMDFVGSCRYEDDGTARPAGSSWS